MGGRADRLAHAVLRKTYRGELMSPLPVLKIGDLTAPLPIIQGGMSVGISLSGLAGAVASEGGVGVIGTAGIAMIDPDFSQGFEEMNNRVLRSEIRKAREISRGHGLLGVNIMVALTNFAELARTAIEEGIDFIFAGAGLPLSLPALAIADMHTRLVPIVSSGRAARLIARRWIEKYNYIPDAFVVEGPLAGGHLGFKLEQIGDPAYALENLVPEVLAETRLLEEKYGKSIPVIAGGGIYTGADIRRFLQMGVAGVQMATRFVTTYECDASIGFKQAYINASKDDIVIIKSPVGLPGRAIRNQFIDDVNQGKKKPFKCPYHCIITCDVENSPYCIALALINAQQGHLDNGFAFSGSNAYRATEIVSVKELIATLRQEYEEAAQEAAAPGGQP
jgi:nitronate monooxygenase